MPFGKKSMVNQFGVAVGRGGGREVNICNTLLCFRLARLIVKCKLKPELLNK